MCRNSKPLEALALLDKFKAQCISDQFPKLYNMIIEKFILAKHRSQTGVLISIADCLIARNVQLTYYNQLEVLFQVYQVGKLPEYVSKLDYSLDINVFNFMLNLILDLGDIKTGLSLFTVVF